MDQQTWGRELSTGPDVMVSYSSHDRAQVMQFVQRLRAAGVAAWIDQGGIDGAQKWGEEIVNAIDACKTVILMISPTSMQSENIAREVMLAWENGKHFLPLVIEDAKIPKSMQYQLAGIQHIKLYEGDTEARFVAVLRALVRLGVRVSPYYIALISADLGDREQAIEWLNRAVEQRSGGLSKLKTEARFNLLHGDARFEELARRAESLPLQAEEPIPEVPVPRAQPAVTRPATDKPLPLWRRIAWPEIVNDRSARKAAAQGVWAGAVLLLLAVLGWLFGPRNPNPVPGIDWNSPLTAILFFLPITYAVQKMGRPAAIIGLSLCSLGALGFLNKVQITGKMLDTAAQYQQYQYQAYRAPNPYLEQLESQYHSDWFSLAISALAAMAFMNATRGTVAYRRMVQSHQAQDKQDAISPEDWAAIKAKIPGLASRPIPRPSPPPVVSAAPVPLQSVAPAPIQAPMPAIEVRAAAPVQMEAAIPRSIPVQAASAAPTLSEDSAVAVAPVRLSFAATVGVSGGAIYWPRVATFLLANLAGGLGFLISRSMASSLSVSGAYWIFELGMACALTLAFIIGFRLVPNLLGALVAAALITAVVGLPLCSLLPTFNWADLGYREQFQQFFLLPFVNTFILLAALAWIVPRLQPMALALWLAAMGAEIVTSFVSNLLHALGAGESPDPVLGGASVISALLRSVAFAVVLWGGLEYVRKKSAASARV